MRDSVGASGVPEFESAAAEQRIRARFAESSAAVMMIGLDGRCWLANPAYCALLGYDEAELRGQDALALVHPSDHTSYRAQLGALLGGQVEQASLAVRCLAKHGDHMMLRCSLSLIRAADGRATQVVLVASSDANSGQPTPVARPGPARILLVDDDSFIRRYAAEMLTQLGYEVTVTATGPEALAAIGQGGDFDLLFTDIVMPGGMNGRELVAAARQLRPTLPVLYTSGFMSSEIVRLTRHDPSALLLEKPYRRVELAQAVTRALAGA